MYKKNQRSEQPLLLSDVHALPERSLKYLHNSWADTFRREIFLRIPEEKFRVLYDPDPSRPNIPVNVLIGLEIIKENRGWSDEELYEHFLFDLQVRYALCCDTFGEGDFDLRTLYYFRKRVSQHALNTGENLFKDVFETVTDEQIQKLGLKTDQQRMDSTQLLSNIADLSRLELLIGAIQRLHRVITEAEKGLYAERIAPYIKERAGQYTYRIKGKQAVWVEIEKVGVVLHDLLQKLFEAYHDHEVYQVAQRFFDENFKLIASEVKAKTNNEIQSGCLQSLDDLEASYRSKGNQANKGYVGNLTETCNPANPVQLVIHTQTKENRVADTQLMMEALPELKERTNLNKMVSDGGYVSEQIDQFMRTYDVEHITTSLTGTLPDHQAGKLAFSDFVVDLDQNGIVTHAVCPAGQSAAISSSSSGKSFKLTFASAFCQECTFFQNHQCPVKSRKKNSLFTINLPKDRANSSQRRRHFESCKQEARNLRPAVEATVFQVKHKLRGGKLRVRGLFPVTRVFTCMTMATNLRRINRYLNDSQRGKFTSRKGRESFFVRFYDMFKTFFRQFGQFLFASGTCFIC